MGSIPLSNIHNTFIRHKKQLVILTAVFVFGLFIYLFNWDWLRPSLVSYVSQKSGRQIQLGRLDVKFSGLLNPTIKLENLYISNATWSDSKPLITAKKIAFTFNAAQFISNSHGRIVHISMADTEINLERLRDGLRNWRLLKPNYKGLGKYIVLSLTAERSLIKFRNHALDLDLTAVISPSLASDNKSTDFKSTDSKNKNTKTQIPLTPTLPNKITLSGNYLKSPFNGIVFSEPRMTFQRTQQLFNVNGYINQAKNRISVSGKIGDVIKNQLVDADIEFSGNIFSIVNLIRMTELAGQDTFSLSTHLLKQDTQYQFTHFAGKFSGSDLNGDLSYFYNQKAPKLSGRFLSESLDVRYILDLFKRLKKTDTGLYNHFSLVDNLKKSETDLRLSVKKMKNINPFELSPLNVNVTGQSGKFDVDIKGSRIYGSKLSGNASLDFKEESPRPELANSNSTHTNLSRTNSTKIQAQIVVDRLQIAKLLNSTDLDDKLSAPMDIKANLYSSGDSFARITKGLSGNAEMTIRKGFISNKLDAKLGLDFGKIFWLSLRGDKNIALNCGKLGFDIKQGVATSNAFWVNTEQTIVKGQGSVDFKNRQVNVLIDPQPKDPSLFSTSKSIQLSGQLGGGDYAINTTTSQLKPTRQASNHDCKNL